MDNTDHIIRPTKPVSHNLARTILEQGRCVPPGQNTCTIKTIVFTNHHANPNYRRFLVTIHGPFSTPLSLCGFDWFAQCQQIAVISVASNTIPPEFSSFHQNTLSNFASFLSAPLLPQITKKILPTIKIEYFHLIRFATNRNSTLESGRSKASKKSKKSKKKKQEDDDDDDDDDGSRPTIHVKEKKRTIKVKLGRAEMHGAFSSRATGDAVTSVNKQMDKRMDAQGAVRLDVKGGRPKVFRKGSRV